MMKNVFIVLFLCVVTALGQLQWTRLARVRHHTEFFSQVIQETIYELERRGFSSLTLSNITQTIKSMYRMKVNGTALYSNGFLVSIQKIDVTDMSQFIGTPTVNGVAIPRGTVSGILNLREAKLGYDVTFTDVNGVVFKTTGDFTHSLITWDIHIQKDLLTGEITISRITSGTSGGTVRMVYRPSKSITEVLSRDFFPYHNSDGVATWSQVIAPIILDVVKNKVPFPEICYSHC